MPSNKRPYGENPPPTGPRPEPPPAPPAPKFSSIPPAPLSTAALGALKDWNAIAEVLSRHTLIDVANARIAQDKQWGGPARDDAYTSGDWLRFIEQQIYKSRVDTTRDGVRGRLVKIATLAIAGIESLDRQAGKR